MANDLSAIIPQILAQGLMVVRENAIMARLVRTDFSNEVSRSGASIDFPIASPMGLADDVIPGPIPIAPPDVVPTIAQIKLNRWVKKDFVLTDKEITELRPDFLPLQLEEAARSIANTMDIDILRLFQFVSNSVGTAGTTPFAQESGATPFPTHMGLGITRQARILLANVSQADRRIVLNPDAEANASMLPQFTSADRAGTDISIREGLIGRKLGLDWYANPNVLTHTRALAGTITTTGTANVAGSKLLNVTGVTTPPNAGDLFTIAGDPRPYTVAPGSVSSTTLAVSPALRQNYAAGTALTVIATGTSVQNLLFHRDAFGIAVRPIADLNVGNASMETFVDDVSGISMRLEMTRENKQYKFCFDVLYGVGVLRPELAVRVLG